MCKWLILLITIGWSSVVRAEERCDPAYAPEFWPKARSYVYHPFSRYLDDHFTGQERELAAAAGCGDIEEVRRLVKFDANPNALSAQGMPLLLWAAYKDNLAGYKALLANGADPNIETHGNLPRQGTTVLHFIIEAADLEFLTAALHYGADPNAVNSDEEPLIHIARRGNQWDKVELLIQAGADVDTFNGSIYGSTVLADALGFGNFQKAYELMTRYGADPTFRIRNAPDPERIGAQPMLEEIFHRPVDAGRYPEAAEWQRRCQQYVLSKGIEPVPIPKRMERFQRPRAETEARP